MFLIGLTGGIATGKSTVSKFLQEEGVPLIDADLVAREVVEPGKPAWKRIKQEFGGTVLNDDGTLDREKLGQIIFADEAKRKQLNTITHPEIYKAIFWKCLRLIVTGTQFAVLDLPLLFESGYMVPFLHKIIVVRCSVEQQLNRLMTRNSLSREDAEARINAQMSLHEKCRRAQYVVNNSLTLEETRGQVREIVAEMRSSWTHWFYRSAAVGIVFGIPIVLYWLYEAIVDNFF